jgi:hypothetical protein
MRPYPRSPSRRRHARFALLTSLVLVACASLGAAAGSPATGGSSISVCNVYLHGLRPGQPDAAARAPSGGGCYGSDAAAEAAARAASAKAGRAHHYVRIGLDCDAGLSEVCAFSDHRWTYGDSGRCDGNTRYATRYVGDAWNDRISGAQGLGGCNRFVHFGDSGFRGPWLSCGHSLSPDPAVPQQSLACTGLGPLNNETSSEEWHHCRNAHRLCFRGRKD